MDPTQFDGPLCGRDSADDDYDVLSAPLEDDLQSEDHRRPGDGDAVVMAWARAM